MFKILLLLQLWHPDTTIHAKSFKDSDYHHSSPTGSLNDGGLIPDQSTYSNTAADDAAASTNKFKDPFDNINKDNAPVKYRSIKFKQIHDTESFMKRFTDSPQSQDSKTLEKSDNFNHKVHLDNSLNQLHTADWNASGAARFVNSPCYKSLGFDPHGNLQEEEKIYSECESEKRNKNILNILVDASVLAGVGLLCYLGIKKT